MAQPPATTAPSTSSANHQKLPNEVLFMIIKEVEDPKTLRNLRQVSIAFRQETPESKAFHTITKSYTPWAFHELLSIADSPVAKSVRKVIIKCPASLNASNGNGAGTALQRIWGSSGTTHIGRQKLLVSLADFENLEEFEFEVCRAAKDAPFQKESWDHVEATLRALSGIRAKKCTLVSEAADVIQWLRDSTTKHGQIFPNCEEFGLVTKAFNDEGEVEVVWNDVQKRKPQGGVGLDIAVHGFAVSQYEQYVFPGLDGGVALFVESLDLQGLQTSAWTLSQLFLFGGDKLESLRLSGIDLVEGSWTTVFRTLGRYTTLSRLNLTSLKYQMMSIGRGDGIDTNVLAEGPRKVFPSHRLYKSDPFALRDLLKLHQAHAQTNKRAFRINPECVRFLDYPSVSEFDEGKKAPEGEEIPSQ